MSNLLAERREEVSKLLDITEQRFLKLKQTFADAKNEDEYADSDLRFAIGDVLVALNITHDTLSE